MKRILLILLIIVTAVLPLAVLSSCLVDRGDIYLQKVDLQAELTEAGDMKVTEKWTVKIDTDDPYRNVYKLFDLSYESGIVKSTLKNISVRDGDGVEYMYDSSINRNNIENVPYSKSNIWYLFDTANGEQEFGVFFPRTYAGTLSFTFQYTITDMVRVYSDSAVLYFKPFSEDFQLFIEEFTAEISIPSSAKNTQGWLHCTADSYLEIRDKSLYIEAADVSGTQIETRALIPKDRFPDVRIKTEKNVKENIIAEEDKWEEDYQKEIAFKRVLRIIDIITAVIIVGLAAAYVVLFNKKNKRAKGEYPEYVREIPEDWTAGELGHLFYYYEGGVKNNSVRGRLLAATTLELARRGYIEILPESGGKDYTIDVKTDIQFKLGDLKQHELTLYNLFKAVEESVKKPFNMNEFEKFAKKQYEFVDSSMRTFQNASKSKFSTSGFIGAVKKAANTAKGVQIAAIAVGAIMFMSGAYMTYLALSLVICGLVTLIGTQKTVPKLNEKGEAEYMRAEGLKKYMLDFSNLKEYDVPKLVLWEEYLVYATMMNISKEVIKSLELVYPELKTPDGVKTGTAAYGYSTRSYLFTYIMLSRMNVSGAGFDIGSRISSSFNNIATTARTLKYSKNTGVGGGRSGGFGGGGFRGGGGGFGGGGGGARR